MTANSFFQELQKLLDSQPKPETLILNSENCFYGDHIFNSKNLAYCFDTSASSDSTYIFDSHLVAGGQDCDYSVESESSYECVDLYKCYNCYYSESLYNTHDTMYCYDLSNCHDMFGCVSLKNKSYCIFNRQLTKEEYEKEVVKYKSLSPEKALAMLEELKLRYPITQSITARNINSPYGNYVYDSKNCYMCFDIGRSEDSSYLYDCGDAKKSMDMSYTYQGTSNSYQIVDSINIYNGDFVLNSENCRDSSYLFNCKGVKNSLGCVGLQYKQYCILNRQFTKEEYEKLESEIKDVLVKADYNWSLLIV